MWQAVKNQNMDSVFKARVKTVRNIFFVYLFTSAVTGRYGIFAAICAAFPFIIPVLFENADDKYTFIVHSLGYGVIGVLASVLFMLVTRSYETVSWLVPALYGLFLCVGFAFVFAKLTSHKRAVLKCIIAVAVCFLAFV